MFGSSSEDCHSVSVSGSLVQQHMRSCSGQSTGGAPAPPSTLLPDQIYLHAVADRKLHVLYITVDHLPKHSVMFFHLCEFVFRAASLYIW